MLYMEGGLIQCTPLAQGLERDPSIVRQLLQRNKKGILDNKAVANSLQEEYGGTEETKTTM